MTTWGRTSALLAAAVLLASCGGGSGSTSSSAPTTNPPGVDQTIDVRMVDIAFQPKTLTVKPGTNVRFVFRNTGDLDHQAAFGDAATQDAVEAGTQKRNGPEVSPGQTKNFTYRFDSPGTTIIGCHVAGHYKAGMKIVITVA